MNTIVRPMLWTYSGSVNRSVKFSSPTKTSDAPNGSVRVKLDPHRLPRGQQEEHPPSARAAA